MADEADQAAGNGSVQDGEQRQHGVLQANAGVRDAAGNGNETGQYEEQGGADANRDNGLNGHLFHGEILLFRMSAL